MPLPLSFSQLIADANNGRKLTSLNGIVQHVICCEQRSGATNRISVSTAISLSTMFDIAWDLLYI